MRNYTLILFAVLIFSCEERFNTELHPIDIGLLAVEAVLTNENIQQKIKLTFPSKQLNGNPAPATGAIVQVQEGNSTVYTFGEDLTKPGEYISTPFRAVFGTTYTLQISLNGNLYSAQDNSESVGPLAPIEYRSVNGQYELILKETGNDPYYIDHKISWQNTSACTPGNLCEGRQVFYDLKSIDVNEIFKPGKTQFLFPTGSVIIRRKYSVSSAYRTFLRSILSETEWRGGPFDVERANAASNLSTGATGFFAISTVVSDTTQIQ